MEAECQKFVDSLVLSSKTLWDTYRETLKYWEPEEPPVTILFGDLGSRISRDFESAASEENRRLFQLIEEAMGSENPSVLTAVATGTVEAMLNRAIQEGVWDRMRALIGPRTLRHAEAWLGS